MKSNEWQKFGTSCFPMNIHFIWFILIRIAYVKLNNSINHELHMYYQHLPNPRLLSQHFLKLPFFPFLIPSQFPLFWLNSALQQVAVSSHTLQTHAKQFDAPLLHSRAAVVASNNATKATTLKMIVSAIFLETILTETLKIISWEILLKNSLTHFLSYFLHELQRTRLHDLVNINPKNLLLYRRVEWIMQILYLGE